MIPELRFPEFSGEWEERRLGEIGEIKGGGTPSTKEKKYWNGSIIWLTPTEITQKYIEKSQRTITKEGLKNSSASLLPKGTILITTRATIGELAIAKKEVSTNQGFQSLIVNSNYSNEFIYYLLSRKRLKKEMIKKANGTTFLEISKEQLSKIKIHLPPTLKEQQKIASFLSTVDEKIEITSKKIKKLKEYKKGLLQKLLKVKNKEPELRFPEFSGEWVEKRLGDIAFMKKGQAITNKDIVKGEVPVIAGGLKPAYYHNKANRRGNIIVVSSSGANAGYVSFWNREIFVSDAFTIELIKGNNKFLFYILKLIQNKIYTYQSGGAQPHIYPKDLKSLKIHLPPTLAEQQKIAEFLSSIDEKIEINEKKLTKLKEYKKGLLQKMFV